MRKPLFIILCLSFMLFVAISYLCSQTQCYEGEPPPDALEVLEAKAVGLTTEIMADRQFNEYMMIFIKIENQASSHTSFTVTIRQPGTGQEILEPMVVCQRKLNILQGSTKWLRHGVISEYPIRFNVEINEIGDPQYMLQATVYCVGHEKNRKAEMAKEPTMMSKESNKKTEFVGTYSIEYRTGPFADMLGDVIFNSDGTCVLRLKDNPGIVEKWYFDRENNIFFIGPNVKGTFSGNRMNFTITVDVEPDPYVYRLTRK